MKNILLLISKGAEILEISPFIDIFGWNSIVGKKNIILKTASFHDIVSNTWNLKIIPEIVLSRETIDVSQYDALIIPGGFGFKGFFEDMKIPEYQNLIREFVKLDKIVIGVCTGVIPLGESGVLIGKKATTYLYDNDRYFKQLSTYGAIPVRKEIVIDEKLITCSGPKNSIDVGFLLLELLSDGENMKKVKESMGF